MERLVDEVSRPPAVCSRRHVHQFSPNGQSFDIYLGVRRLLRITLRAPYCNDDLKHCVLCGGDLRSVES